jgi:hypothetical protein
MLGLQSVGVILAYVLTILAAVLCVVYGIVNWNKPAGNQEKEAREGAAWEAKDSEVNK